jgi:hypothetical protein
VTKVGPDFMRQVADASSRDYRLLWGEPENACDANGRPLS